MSLHKLYVMLHKERHIRHDEMVFIHLSIIRHSSSWLFFVLLSEFPVPFLWHSIKILVSYLVELTGTAITSARNESLLHFCFISFTFSRIAWMWRLVTLVPELVFIWFNYLNQNSIKPLNISCPQRSTYSATFFPLLPSQCEAILCSGEEAGR